MSLVRVTRINNKGVERALALLSGTLKDIAVSLRLIQEQVTGFKRNDVPVESDDEAPEVGGHATDEEGIIVAELKDNPQLREIVAELEKSQG